MTSYSICTGPKDSPHAPVIFVRYAVTDAGFSEGGCPVCTTMHAILTAARGGEDKKSSTSEESSKS